MTWLQAIILAVVEGLTEYLPVSSTAHMIFTSSIMHIQKDEFVKMFEVSIQFGAILAVVCLYWRKFFDFSRWQFYVKLAFAVLPALLLGYLFNDAIDEILEKPVPIAIALIAGGIVLLFIDNVFKRPKIDSEKRITLQKAVTIGVWQCLAMMPGVSRAAASIIGGMQQRLTRQAAAEFSFFLAVPTMLAVTVYSIFLKHWDVNGTEQKGYEMIGASHQNMAMFFAGNAIAFIIAMVAIRFFIGFIKRYGFRLWGVYRIIIGAIILILAMMNVISV